MNLSKKNFNFQKNEFSKVIIMNEYQCYDWYEEWTELKYLTSVACCISWSKSVESSFIWSSISSSMAFLLPSPWISDRKANRLSRSTFSPALGWGRQFSSLSNWLAPAASFELTCSAKCESACRSSSVGRRAWLLLSSAELGDWNPALSFINKTKKKKKFNFFKFFNKKLFFKLLKFIK